MPTASLNTPSAPTRRPGSNASRVSITNQRKQNVFAVKTGATSKPNEEQVKGRLFNIESLKRNATLEKMDMLADLIEYEYEGVLEIYQVQSERDFLKSYKGLSQEELFKIIQDLGATL